MFAKSFSSLIVAASLAVSSLGFAATPSTAVGATPAVTPVTKSVKIRHQPRPASPGKVMAPSKTPARAATPAVQPRTPSKTTNPKAVRTSKIARPAVKSGATSAKPAVR